MTAHLRALALATGGRELLTGLVANSRPLEIDGQRILGLFLNTLPLRMKLAGHETWRQLLRRVFAAEQESLPHRRYPAGRLQRRFGRAEPLFETAFNYNHFHVYQGLAGRGGIEVSQPRMFEYTNFTLLANFDLAPAGDGLVLRLNYDAAEVEAAQAASLAGYYLKALEALAATPDSGALETDLLGPQRETLLETFNATQVAWPEDGPSDGEHGAETLLGAFQRQARQRPEAAAVLVDGGQTLSYRGLDERSNQVGRWLRRQGVGRDAVVGVLAERSADLLAALYGVLKAGGAYLPLEAEWPAERVRQVLADSRAEVVLLQSPLAERLGDWAGRRLAIDSDWPQEATDPLPARAGPQDLAYVIYTSGSTGRPKGAAVEHAGIVNRLRWMQAAYGLAPGERVLQKTPISFDVSLWELFWPLAEGATLVLARPGGQRDAAYLADVVRRQEVTTLHFVPSLLAVFLQEPGLDACSALRRVVASGEALSYELVERFYQRLPQAALYNLYGPTEAAVDVTHWSCAAGDLRRVVPIGRPIANMRTYVLDGRMQPLPLGVPGELHLAGVGLARGYLEHPELTAAAFLPDPFSPTSGGRLYKTGDLARWLPDGTLQYLGRLDAQLKVRGQRIEPAEIESVLGQHPQVLEAAVTARVDSGHTVLAAYVVPRQAGAGPSAEQLSAWLKERLPAGWTPSSFSSLAALPRTSSGKLERRKLPAPQAVERGLETPYAAPRGPVEGLLAEVWAEVLARRGWASTTTSLPWGATRSTPSRSWPRPSAVAWASAWRPSSAPARCAAWRRSRGTRLRVTGPWRCPRRGPRPGPCWRPRSGSPLPADVEDAYPLADLQAGMLFHSALSPETAVYHDVFSARVATSWDEPRLRAVLAELVQRHAALRTSFALSGYRQPLALVHRQVARALRSRGPS